MGPDLQTTMCEKWAQGLDYWDREENRLSSILWSSCPSWETSYKRARLPSGGIFWLFSMLLPAPEAHFMESHQESGLAGTRLRIVCRLTLFNVSAFWSNECCCYTNALLITYIGRISMCKFFKRFSRAVLVRHSWHCCHCWHCLPKAYSLHFSLYLFLSLSFLSCFALPNFLAYHSAAPRSCSDRVYPGGSCLGAISRQAHPYMDPRAPSLCFPWRSNTMLSTSPQSICHPPNGSSPSLLFSNAEIKR